MRIEILFLRWLLVTVAVVLAFCYARSFQQSPAQAKYETVPLIQGGRSVGMPLVGIAINPEQREAFAIVAGDPKAEAQRGEFFIVWKGREGETYSTTFSADKNGADALHELLKDGQVRTVHTFKAGAEGDERVSQNTGNAETQLRTILQALPATSGLRPPAEALPSRGTR